MLSIFRFKLFLYLLSAPFFYGAVQASALKKTELIMFESPICEWCEVWHDEIGAIYPKTLEGCIATLRVVDITKKKPDDLSHINNIRYTPTFVLMEGGQEIDRINGYPGEDFFWGLLNNAIAKTKQEEKIACAARKNS